MKVVILKPSPVSEGKMPTLYAQGRILDENLRIEKLECARVEMLGDVRVIVEPEATFHDNVRLHIGSIPREKSSKEFPDVGLVVSFRDRYSQRQLQLRRKDDIIVLFILPPAFLGESWKLPEFWSDSEVLFESKGHL